MTRPGETEAVEAALETTIATERIAREVVAAAYPVIAAAVLADAKEQIAAHAESVLRAAEETRGTHEYAMFASADLMARVALAAVSGSGGLA